MTAAANPRLKPGCVYRTRDLARWSANPTRLAQRLVREGRLTRLGHGLFAAPQKGKWGLVPPSEGALLRSFLAGAPFLMTGSTVWNRLGLGATQVLAQQLVYTPRRSGQFVLDGRPFWLRRKAFPRRPSAEWFTVDLLQNLALTGLSEQEATDSLARLLARGALDHERLRAAARRFGTQATQAFVEGVCGTVPK